MSREQDIMLFAPVPHIVREGFGKTLTYEVVVLVPYNRILSIRQLPEQLRQRLEQAVSVTSCEILLEIIRERYDHRTRILRKAQPLLRGKLRLIGKYRRDVLPKILSQPAEVPLVRHLYEFVDRFFVQRIYIGLVIEPGIVSRNLEIRVFYVFALSCRFTVFQHPVGRETAVPERDRISGKQSSLIALYGRRGRYIFLDLLRLLVGRLARKNKKT